MKRTLENRRIFLAGHRGMVGSAILRALQDRSYQHIITATRRELDLLDQSQVWEFFNREKPQVVILAAAVVGGIQANIENPAGFLYENLQIQNHVIDSAFRTGVENLVFLASSCIYPKNCVQPMKEEHLLSGKLEPTNEGYALAKIAGLKLTEAYYKQYGMKSINLIPCNLYGPNDSFDLSRSHVLSALVKKFCDAKEQGLNEISLWGSGIARREFMHVDDMADAVLYMLENDLPAEPINIGCGDDISIKELAELIAAKVDFKGRILWDATKPDGMLRKCMDVSKMRRAGFEPKIGLSEGVEQMIRIYKNITL